MQFGLRTLLFVMLLLGMLVASYPLLFKPLNAQRDAAINETHQNQQQLDKLAGVMKSNKDLTAQNDSLRGALTSLEGKLPRATEMDHVLQDVYKAATDNNLLIKSERLAKPVDSANYSEQPIRMVVQGQYRTSFFKFLSTVENLNRLTKIKEMKIEVITEDAGAKVPPGTISADFILTIYYENSQKVAVAQ